VIPAIIWSGQADPGLQLSGRAQIKAHRTVS
jgi:hypothetical protein